MEFTNIFNINLIYSIQPFIELGMEDVTILRDERDFMLTGKRSLSQYNALELQLLKATVTDYTQRSNGWM